MPSRQSLRDWIVSDHCLLLGAGGRGAAFQIKNITEKKGKHIETKRKQDKPMRKILQDIQCQHKQQYSRNATANTVGGGGRAREEEVGGEWGEVDTISRGGARDGLASKSVPMPSP